MVSKAKQASNKHKLVAERAGLVKHQMAIASAAQDELKLRNRSLLECQQINQALNRQLQRERMEAADSHTAQVNFRRGLSNRILDLQTEVKQERKWKRIFMGIGLLNGALALVDVFLPAVTAFTRGLSFF